MVSDKDFLTILHKVSCSSMVIGACLHYLIMQIDLMIERRKQDLLVKKPGALMSDEFPKIVWVRMLKCPKLNLTNNKAIYQLRSKFNAILEERLRDGKADNHYIMSIHVSLNDFDLTGHLTSSGKATFWKEVNQGLMKFNHGKITLRPRHFQVSSKPNVSLPDVASVEGTSGHKLPSPPPNTPKEQAISSKSQSPARKRKRVDVSPISK